MEEEETEIGAVRTNWREHQEFKITNQCWHSQETFA